MFFRTVGFAVLWLALGCQREPNRVGQSQRQPVASASQAIAAPAASVEKSVRKARTHQLDVTFLVASDTHLGFDVSTASGRDILKQPMGIERTNLRMIESMNGVPGRAFPEALGGVLATPRGVLITGDLTEKGGVEQWGMFEQMYGRSGQGGPLKFPVFEGDGNHDRVLDWHVRDQIAKRHGGRYYSFDWDDLHLVCLSEAPEDDGIAFLDKDLARIEKGVPVVLFMHLPLLGPWSENWWTEQNGPQKLERAITGHNVIGIFHGHYHATGGYRWQAYDVYNVGSPKDMVHTYLVVEVRNDKMRVGAFNYDTLSWWWWHEKPINEGTTPRRSWVMKARPGGPQPVVRL